MLVDADALAATMRNAEAIAEDPFAKPNDRDNRAEETKGGVAIY